jgi:CheY-like chemotaxis protein
MYVGKEAAERIRAQNKTVPIIFLTGEIASDMLDVVVKFKPCQLALKPCSKSDLLKVRQQQLSQHLIMCDVCSCHSCVSVVCSPLQH